MPASPPERPVTAAPAPLPPLDPLLPRDADIDYGLDWDSCLPPGSEAKLALDLEFDTEAPMQIAADSMQVWPEQEIGEFSGGVVVVRNQARVEADWARYDRPQQLLDVEGNIYFEQPGLRLASDNAHFDLGAEQGTLGEVEYRLTDSHARGQAAEAKLLSREQSRYRDITYSTCRPGQDDWVLQADDLEIDRATGTGKVRRAKLRLGGVPVAYLPYASFPIDDRRKSGLLAPSAGIADTTGFDLKVPYYLNLAPNYDATLIPRIMSKRGFMLGGQFRYLTESQRGEIEAEILPSDQDAKAGDPELRGAFAMRHQGRFGSRLSTDIDLNYVSDDQYLEDFGTSLEISSTRQLERRGDLLYRGNDWFLRGRLQYYQTVDPAIAPEDRPYSRMPQVLFSWDKPRQHYGMHYALGSEYVYFNHTNDSNTVGHRFALEPAVSLPLRASYGHLTPKLKLNYRYYELSDTKPSQDNRQSLLLPSVSLDGGLVFERDTGWFGYESLQTLEPRLFYLYTPYKDQSDIPIFDTAEIGFNFNSLFRENRFTGRDRIGDANQLTLALTSRTLDLDSGTELLRASIGQIYFFRDRRVQLPGVPEQDDYSSTLAAEAAARLSQRWSTRGSLFWNPHDGGFTDQASVQLHYQDSADRIVNLSYRYNRGRETNLTDTRIDDTNLSFRWPFGSRLHLVGRWKYSLFYDTTMDSFAGFEYDDCCWTLRALARRYVNDVDDDPKNAIMLQLELKGLGAVGNRIDDFLTEGILGYQAE